MATLGLPYFFEDTTGLESGPTDFLDIYDRPPFLRLSNSHYPHTSVPTQNSKSSRTLPTADDREGRTFKIFELGAPAYTNSGRQRHDGIPPSAELVLGARGCARLGSVRFRGGTTVPLEKWLRKSTTFGSTLTRQFKGPDGMYYQWKFRSVQNHEWACVQLGTNCLVAHYDVRSPREPVYRTSGNVLTVYENFVHFSVELLASLVVMNHIRMMSSSY